MLKNTSPVRRVMDEEQAEATAALLHTIRPDWDEAGIYRFLEPQLPHREATDLLGELVTAAADPQRQVPAVSGSVDQVLNDIERGAR